MIGLITDKVNEVLLEKLDLHGYKFDYLPDIERDELNAIIGNYEYIIVRSRTKVDKELIDNAVKLKLIIRFGVGLDNIDVQYANNKGIKVYNTPSAFVNAVAELTLGLILCSLRSIGEAHCTMKKGLWEKKRFYGYELRNKIVAILGFGRIGRRLADLLLPFRTKIKAYDIVPIPEKYKELGVLQVSDLKDAVKDANIITLHMPLTNETKNMLNMEVFKAMKKQPFIINTARGEIIDLKDLKTAINKGIIKGAALDVYPNEPPNDPELLELNNLLLTPHIGAQTYEANKKAAEEIINILKKEVYK